MAILSPPYDDNMRLSNVLVDVFMCSYNFQFCYQTSTLHMLKSKKSSLIDALILLIYYNSFRMCHPGPLHPCM